MRLPPEVLAAGYRLIALGSTGSTSDEAAAAARAGDGGRLWLIAEEQRAGRGRHGRAWSSPRGNLYASLLLVDPCRPARAAELGFVAGVALHQAVAAATGLAPPRLSLKWPNDLLLDGGKTAGILLDGHRLQGGGFAVVIGIGVNIAAAPAEAPYRTACLGAAAPGLTPAFLFPLLAAAMAESLARWQAAPAGSHTGFAGIRREWLARAAGLGAEITVRAPGGARQGRFRGLDDSGRLELATASGIELVDAGDLFFAEARHEGGPSQAAV